MWLHRFAALVSASTVLLIVAGGLVTSTASGLAVPDWPTTYGWSLFGFPLDKMVGGIFYEHGHRLIASTVGMLTIGLAVWLWVSERRAWLRRLGVGALAAVIAQGLLGGLTVIYFLPAPVSVAHAGLAQIFFCLTISIALFTSPGWQTAAPYPANDLRLRQVATATTALIYAQILLGATMRHTGAGLAIPDFPLVFGGLVPPAWTASIAVHYAHRIGALVVTLAILATVGHVRFHHGGRRELTRPAAALLLLVLIQIALGGMTVLSRRAVAINTAHVATGALVLATSLVLALRSWRERFAPAPTGEPHAPPGLTGQRSSIGARA
jgi:cytochrome c oxidase assembly protein subunit 15